MTARRRGRGRGHGWSLSAAHWAQAAKRADDIWARRVIAGMIELQLHPDYGARLPIAMYEQRRRVFGGAPWDGLPARDREKWASVAEGLCDVIAAWEHEANTDAVNHAHLADVCALRAKGHSVETIMRRTGLKRRAIRCILKDESGERVRKKRPDRS